MSKRDVVVLGAARSAIGTFSGQKVVQYSHKHPHNLFDRVMLGTKVVPTADGGMEMRVSIPW